MKQFTKRLVLTAVAVAVSVNVWAGKITVKGSDTLLILAQKWSEVYMTNHPETRIQVTGGGSGIGIVALQYKSTDLCDASRLMNADEIANCIAVFRKRPTEYKVALDGLSVFVNRDNPLNEITIEQLERLFTGKIQNWKELGGSDAPITVYNRENTSGTHEFFKEHVLDGADFVVTAQTMPGTKLLLQAVARDKNGIGYGGAAYGVGAKALRISKVEGSPAVAPTEENVVNGTYPLRRYLYVYLNPAIDKGEIAAYLNWIRSDEGQKIVKEVGYFPLPKNLRE